MFHEYPMWVTHEDGAQCVVESEAAFVALGDGWAKPARAAAVPREKQPDFVEYPKWVDGKLVHSADEEAALTPVTETAPEETDERAALLHIAVEKGMKVDKRWSNEKIRATLELL